MNKNVIDAMNSINSIDRLQDEAYLDVHNAIMESQNKYEIIKEHGTVEYAQNEFYQESVLAGVLISLGVIGLIVSTILIIKKVNETSGKGSGKGTATPDKPAADMNLFESKSIEDKKKEFEAKVNEILKKIGKNDDDTRDKLFEIAKCNKKLNAQAITAVANAMDAVADLLDNFANIDPNDDSYAKEADSIITKIGELNKTIESNLDSLIIDIGEGESKSTAIADSFTVAASISDKLKKYEDKLSKVEPKLKALSEKAKKESKGAESGAEGSDANNQNAGADLEALQKKANTELQPMGKDNNKFFETIRGFFNTVMSDVNKADYSSLTQQSQPAQQSENQPVQTQGAETPTGETSDNGTKPTTTTATNTEEEKINNWMAAAKKSEANAESETKETPEEEKQQDDIIQSVRNLADKFDLVIEKQNEESFREGVLGLRNKNKETIKFLIDKYNDPNSDENDRGFIIGLFELAGLNINNYLNNSKENQEMKDHKHFYNGFSTDKEDMVQHILAYKRNIHNESAWPEGYVKRYVNIIYEKGSKNIQQMAIKGITTCIANKDINNAVIMYQIYKEIINVNNLNVDIDTDEIKNFIQKFGQKMDDDEIDRRIRMSEIDRRLAEEKEAKKKEEAEEEKRNNDVKTLMSKYNVSRDILGADIKAFADANSDPAKDLKKVVNDRIASYINEHTPENANAATKNQIKLKATSYVTGVLGVIGIDQSIVKSNMNDAQIENFKNTMRTTTNPSIFNMTRQALQHAGVSQEELADIQKNNSTFADKFIVPGEAPFDLDTDSSNKKSNNGEVKPYIFPTATSDAARSKTKNKSDGLISPEEAANMDIQKPVWPGQRVKTDTSTETNSESQPVVDDTSSETSSENTPETSPETQSENTVDDKIKELVDSENGIREGDLKFLYKVMKNGSINRNDAIASLKRVTDDGDVAKRAVDQLVNIINTENKGLTAETDSETNTETSPVQQTVTPEQQAENTETSPVNTDNDEAIVPPITVTNNQTPETKKPELDTIAKRYNIDYNNINTVYDLFKAGDNRANELTKGDDGAAEAAREIEAVVANEKLNEQPTPVNTQQAATQATTEEPKKKGVFGTIVNGAKNIGGKAINALNNRIEGFKDALSQKHGKVTETTTKNEMYVLPNGTEVLAEFATVTFEDGAVYEFITNIVE